MSNEQVHVLHWSNQQGQTGIIGVFEDEELAHKTYDCLEQHGDKDKIYMLDNYELDTIQKGSR